MGAQGTDTLGAVRQGYLRPEVCGEVAEGCGGLGDVGAIAGMAF
ncbi:MAG: hypothetical protein O3C67_03270 [Cyanobacteria bacterium]|nr:hypothetical protein [Cyanobacteriota bacterium]